MSYNYVLTMVSGVDEAKKIAQNLVTKHLAACVNIIPKVISVYEWNNEVCCEDEFVLMIKTKTELFEDVKNEILALHSYELPAIVSIPVEQGYEPFLRWVDQQCAEK